MKTNVVRGIAMCIGMLLFAALAVKAQAPAGPPSAAAQKLATVAMGGG